ncbi:pantoate--beta-alanine ligase [Microvirga antarctica]|uniref:pantoate--beta-alanine ligase n=1 Tax=Microvirga antarctica TaxID=2819233 RepID=UPI001B30273A|nr:pantoate--beta-alanine ligase [Microvirga antarctica]
MSATQVVDRVVTLRESVGGWRGAGQRIALVPTMGALHEGHVSLVRLAKAHADKVVVSIFVNPTQFAPTEDLAKYPRPFEADRQALSGLADLIFSPPVEEMYRPGDSTRIQVAGPATVRLEDRFRPTHFEGVATVVAKLFHQVQPDVALFGEKDYQQFRVLVQMVQDLHMPVELLAGPTIRAPSGLALSSRNRYLDEEEREHAAIIYQTLRSCAEGIRAGDTPASVMEAGFAVLSKADFHVDYFEARDAETLMPTEDPERALHLLVAARLNTTRLIDNIAV